jgi:hypothetical protein
MCLVVVRNEKEANCAYSKTLHHFTSKYKAITTFIVCVSLPTSFVSLYHSRVDCGLSSFFVDTKKLSRCLNKTHTTYVTPVSRHSAAVQCSQVETSTATEEEPTARLCHEVKHPSARLRTPPPSRAKPTGGTRMCLLHMNWIIRRYHVVCFRGKFCFATKNELDELPLTHTGKVNELNHKIITHFKILR